MFVNSKLDLEYPLLKMHQHIRKDTPLRTQEC